MMIRVGMISYWHVHAEEYTGYAVKHPETEIAAIWDENLERGKAMSEKYGVPFVASLDDLLGDASIDAVVVDTPTDLEGSERDSGGGERGRRQADRVSAAAL